MNCEILAVGTELLLGNTVNTDASGLSELLAGLGINVFWHSVVGDNPARLRDAVAIAKSRAGLIITTGGLGPTYDDLTKNVLADCFGKKLVFHEDEAEGIRCWFARSGRPCTENNLQQAYLPEDCVVFHNDWGTAPGCAFFAEGVHVVMLPGPPHECIPMFRHCAVPYLRSLSEETLVSRQIRVFGMGESAVEALFREEMEHMENPSLATYAKEGEVMLRVTAKAAAEPEAAAMCEPVVKKVCDTLGDIVYGVDVDSLEALCLSLLKEKGMTFSSAESLTGGLFGMNAGDTIFMRGPYGNAFPVERFKGKDLVVIAGGTGVSPVRSMLRHFHEHPEEIRSVSFIVGFKDLDAVLFEEDLNAFARNEKFRTIYCLDNMEAEGFHKGFVTNYIPEIPFASFEDYNVVVVGPPAMIRFTAKGCMDQGVPAERIWVSLERRMSCAVGKCGHCKIGDVYVCQEGPVFNYAQAKDFID